MNVLICFYRLKPPLSKKSQKKVYNNETRFEVDSNNEYVDR
jgi:hypothetical protein